MRLEKYLEDLETRISPEVEEDLQAQWRGFLDGQETGGIFSPRRSQISPPAVEWPRVPVNDALDDLDAMLLQQLGGCSDCLATGGGAVLNIRANYGTGILPSVFGAEMFIMERELDTLPTARHLPGGRRDMELLLSKGVPDVRMRFGGRCFEALDFFQSTLAAYPKTRRLVRIFHPDLQGPMDVCELLWGSGLFLDLVDVPELVESVLGLITETYKRFMSAWDEQVEPREEYASHWGLMHNGHIMLRDDSAMNLSPEMFDRFIAPYDGRLLDVLGGGAIHFCGRGDHYIDRLSTIKGLHAVNLSQPECNNMDVIFTHTIDCGLKLLGLRRETAEAALAEGRDLHGLVHCY